MLALLLSVMFVFACSAVTAEEAADENICTYVIYNVTGEKVTELYLTDNNSGEQSENYADELVLTLKFVTESGYEAEFTTLHFENVQINLLAPDAMTGATPISFSMPAAE